MIAINPYYQSWRKRVFDLCFSICLLVLLSPLFILVGLTIYVTSGFPIIFKQKRSGLNGKEFVIYKFRTMEKNASITKHKYLKFNEAPLPMFKIHNDPRFVGFGRFFSRSGIDELPQLLNILKNEMSFVGPRPLPVKEANLLPKTWKNFREKVKPGIFSDWSLAEKRHSDIKQWEKLEQATILKNEKEQYKLIVKMVIYLLRKALKIFI